MKKFIKILTGLLLLGLLMAETCLATTNSEIAGTNSLTVKGGFIALVTANGDTCGSENDANVKLAPGASRTFITDTSNCNAVQAWIGSSTNDDNVYTTCVWDVALDPSNNVAITLQKDTNGVAIVLCTANSGCTPSEGMQGTHCAP